MVTSHGWELHHCDLIKLTLVRPTTQKASLYFPKEYARSRLTCTILKCRALSEILQGHFYPLETHIPFDVDFFNVMLLDTFSWGFSMPNCNMRLAFLNVISVFLVSSFYVERKVSSYYGELYTFLKYISIIYFMVITFL